MPDFDANDDMRLPGSSPEGLEDLLRAMPRIAARRAPSRRRRRLSCSVAALAAAGSRHRRARCQTRRALPPGQRG